MQSKKKLGWLSHVINVIPHFGQTHGILSVLHWPWGLHTRRGSSQLFLHVPNDTLQVLARLAHHDGPWVDSEKKTSPKLPKMAVVITLW